MTAGTLWAYPGQHGATKVRAVAAFGDVEITIGEPYEHHVTNKTPEFLKKFPVGKVPAFETAEGLHIFETIAIAAYVAGLSKNAGLLSHSLVGKALVDQWIAFVALEVSAPAYALFHMLHHAVPYNRVADTHYRVKLATNIDILEKHLNTQTFFVGHRITLADISIAVDLKSLFGSLADAQFRAKIPNLVRFYNTVANHPKLKPIFGETVFIEKGMQYTAPAKPEKEKAPVAAAPPKEKAAPKPKPADDDDDDDALTAEEPKAKNPLDLLPKSEFNLEDWKRSYSNLDTRGAGGSIEWFYHKFDKDGFSVWRCDFKYPEELTQVFMSSNLITGFFNRLEGSRKYLFGSVGVLGENNNSLVSGVFICRGKDIKPVVEVAPDHDSYNYKEINFEHKADKEFFEAALAWDLEIDGKKWADGKAFK
ncbi:hypothetical protein FRB96_005537 [Tulasnella sp. 330]|nr:hypothetical protein FRB96_005537 [Tulasnella sp. 330]KAG8879385.1 hypothetical protein FRB97_001656 [Tulasnella sp. 331]KAG8887892.1 hypothetical protein FRB98_008787 [Tulasnella sp. 332]